MSKTYQGSIRVMSKGFGILGWLLMIPVAILVLLLLVIGYYEGRKAFWDAKIREMCEKDGNVRILERVRISKAEIGLLGRNNGKIAVPVKDLAPAGAPVYAESKTTRLKDLNPEVRRMEVVVIRRADQKPVARWIYYSRIGGDFPTFAHPSSFGCPDLRRITSELDRMFIVEGDSK
jgi:hypothetical protein